MSNKENIKDIFLFYADTIIKFNKRIKQEFSTSNIPYEDAGKLFPKIGTIDIQQVTVPYRFHGAGCTFFWNEIEVYFSVDVTNKNWIVITPGGLQQFLSTYLNVDKIDDLYPIESVLQYLVDETLLLTRENSKGTFVLNNESYSRYGDDRHYKEKP